MNRYLIALDMDGTLLKRDQSVSPFTIETIRKVIEITNSVIEIYFNFFPCKPSLNCFINYTRKNRNDRKYIDNRI